MSQSDLRLCLVLCLRKLTRIFLSSVIVRRVNSYILMTRRLTSDIGLTASSKHLARTMFLAVEGKRSYGGPLKG